MNSDRETRDVVAETSVTSPGMDNPVGATIELWRAPNRIWLGFPALVVLRAASRLVHGRRGRPAFGEGGVVTVFLDGSRLGAISPKQMTVYQVSPGEHSLNLHFLWGLRRSRKLSVALGGGEVRQFVCVLNGLGWPSIRPATPQDVAAMESWQARPV